MAEVVFHNSYKLKKGVSIPDFLNSVEELNNEYISKQDGYISFELLVDGETWADTTRFETMEDAQSFAKCGTPSEVAKKFYSFINLNSCKSNIYSVEKNYK